MLEKCNKKPSFQVRKCTLQLAVNKKARDMPGPGTEKSLLSHNNHAKVVSKMLTGVNRTQQLKKKKEKNHEYRQQSG